jgi:hypothetical protein
MKIHQKLITVLSILVAINIPLFAQVTDTPVKPLPINRPKVVETTPKIDPIVVESVDSKVLFRREIVKAAVSAQKKGLIKRLDLVRLRVAVLSPAFLNKAEDLAVVQMAASGEDGPFETSDSGEIIRETINWEGLTTFLEKLVPLLLALLAAFGA